MDHFVLDDLGNGSRNKSKASISLYGVQVAHIKNTNFDGVNDLRLHLVVDGPITNISNCNSFESGKIVVNDHGYQINQITYDEVKFKYEDSYELIETSKLAGKADDGSNLGVVL